MLCFPKIYPTGRFGKDYNREKPISDTMFIRQRMRNKDRRFMDPAYLFHLCHYQDMKTINGSVNFMLRKTKIGDEHLLINSILKQDPQFEAELSAMFPQLRSHEGYWKQRNHELHTMIK